MFSLLILLSAMLNISQWIVHLSLMFVPAGVGVIWNLEVLSSDWVALLVILTLSTVLSMLVTVAIFIAMKRLMMRWVK